MARPASRILIAMAMLLCSALGAVAATSTSSDPTAMDGGAWIVYNGSVGSGAGIRIVAADGTGDRALFAGAVDGEAWHPDWSRDGRQLAFAVDDVDGTRDIWIGTSEGDRAQRLYDCSAPCAWADDPSWSPDDGTILFQQGSAVGTEGLGEGSLEIVDVGSHEIRRLVTRADGEYFFVPRWAPDGERIVVEVDRFASARLDESEVVESGIAMLGAADPGGRLTTVVADRRAGYPDWSPDGERIVFQAPADPARPDGPSDLFVISQSGGDPERLTTTGADGRQALQPSWTRDGAVVFVEQDAMFENVRMALIDADGQNLRSATGDVDLSGTHPRFGPRSSDP